MPNAPCFRGVQARRLNDAISNIVVKSNKPLWRTNR